MGDHIDLYLNFFNEFNKSVDTTDQLPVKIIAGNLRDHDIIGCVIDWTQQYLAARQCPSSLIAQICKYVVTEMQVYRAVDPGGCGYQKESNVWNPLKLMQATIRKVIDVCQRHKDRNSVSKLTPPRDNLCLTVLSTNKNARRTMEDKYTIIDDLHEMLNIEGYGPGSFYGVFDGHGGAEAAMYGSSRLFQCLAESPLYPSQPAAALVHAFKQCDAQYVEKAKAENLQSGTTAVAAILLQELRQLYVAWIGDTQAVMSRRGGEITQLVSPPHRPNLDSEKERIERMGGCVLYFNGQCRVQGTLAVSRAIGDKDFKPYVCADPEVLTIDLDGSEDFLLLATDGLWEEVTEVEVAETVYRHLIQYTDQNLKLITDSLIRLAKSRGSKDNITCLLVFLRPPSSVPAVATLPRLRVMQSPPPLTSPGPRYNGSGPYLGEEDFGPETDVDGDVKRHLHAEIGKTNSALDSNEHVLQLSSDSEGEEGGGWDFVQTPSVKDTLQLSSNKRQASHIQTNSSSDSEADDMNHPLNPDAAEFVPVHSPDHTTSIKSKKQEEFFGNNGHGNDHEFDLGNNKVDLGGNDLANNHKVIDLGNDLGDVINGKHDVGDKLVDRLSETEDQVLACSPPKPKGLPRLEDERDFLSNIQKRPSSGYENEDHDDMNGFQSLDSSHTHATLGDTTYMSDLTSPAPNHIGSGDVTTSSLSPSSPELHTGAVINPFDLSASNALEKSSNISNDFEEKHGIRDDFGFNASPFEQNGFSNDFTGTNQEDSKNETLAAGEIVDKTQHIKENINSHATIQNDFSSVESNHLDDGHEERETKPSHPPLQDSFAADSSTLSQHQDMPQFDANTFNEFHTANDASAIFEKTSETSDFFGKDQSQIDLSLSSHHPVSLAEETINSMMNLVNTPQERRVSSDVLDAYNAVVHSMDTPLGQNHTEDFDFHSQPKQETFESLNAQREEGSFHGEEDDIGNGSYVEESGNVKKEDEIEDDSGEGHGDLQGSESMVEKGLKSPNPFETSEQAHRTETDEFEFHQEANANAQVNASADETDNIFEKSERKVDVETIVIQGMTPGDFLQKHGGFDNGSAHDDEMNGIHKDENHDGSAAINLASADKTDDLFGKLEREADVETIIIPGMTPGDFLQKQGGFGNGSAYDDEMHSIHKDENHDGSAAINLADNKDCIKEEDEEEEIHIGKKVSDLNETDIMSRSFYGDYESQEPARSPSPEEMIDHYERQQKEKRVETPEALGEQELTPTGDATTLEAKLAQEDSLVENKQKDGHFIDQVEEKPQEEKKEILVDEKAQEIVEDKSQEDTPQSHHVEEKPSNLFDISHEEASFTEKTSQEVYDDLTFETQHNESSLLTSTPSTLGINPDESITQESKLDAYIIESQTPVQDTKLEEHSEENISAPTIPDVVPTLGDDSQSTPTVDLTQDIVEEKKVPPPQEESKISLEPIASAETAEVKDTSASNMATTVAAASAIAAGTVAAAAAVKKATGAAKKPIASSAAKKPEPKAASKTAAKPLLKPSVTKTSVKPATTTTAPAKPTTKPAALKPLVSKPATKPPAPKPVTTTAPRKPLASSALSKTSATSVSTAPKPLATKPAAPKPRPAASVPAKPLTNGVAKRPASATSTAAPASKTSAPRVPLSMRPSKPATGSSTTKPSVSAPKPATTALKSSTTASKSTATKLSTTASKPTSAPSAAKSSATAPKPSRPSSTATKLIPPPVKSPSAAAAAVAAARKSPATRRPLVARGKSSPSTAITKTEPRSEADAVIRKPTPVPSPGDAPVEVMTNGH